MGILQRRVVLSEFLRFASVFVITTIPILAVGAIAPAAASNDRYIALLLFAGVTGLMLMVLLPAWPVIAAVVPKTVSPIRVFRATSGHRWGLVCTAVIGSVGNRLTPDIHTATDGGKAAFICQLGALLTVYSLAIAIGTAATAWQFAAKNDESLMG